MRLCIRLDLNLKQSHRFYRRKYRFIIESLILAVFGGIVWLASLLTKGTGRGFFEDILLDIAGSIIGG